MVNNMDYEQMVEFVKDYFESHDALGTQLTYRYPFRRRFDHCLRCSIWAHRIAATEGADPEIIRISALFHDIGKSVDFATEGHGQVGAKICSGYLSSISYDQNRSAKLVQIIRNHDEYAVESNASLEAKVVSDADLLDETGAITVLWDAMACAGEDAPSYEKAFDRITGACERIKDKLPDRIHTQTARQILRERLSFLDTFPKNLEDELGRNETQG